jgi:hypothetical protein
MLFHMVAHAHGSKICAHTYIHEICKTIVELVFINPYTTLHKLMLVSTHHVWVICACMYFHEYSRYLGRVFRSDYAC